MLGLAAILRGSQELAPQDDGVTVFTACDVSTGGVVRPGKSPDVVSSPICKNNFVFIRRKSLAYDAIPRPQEGRFAIVTNVGRGGRWTQKCRETNGTDADGEVVWS